MADKQNWNDWNKTVDQLGKLVKIDKLIAEQLAEAAKNKMLEEFDKASPGLNSGQNEFGNWPGLSEKYKATKAKKGVGKGKTDKLILKGDLRKAIEDSPKSAKIEDHQIKMTIESDYAKTHNDGSDNIPARPFAPSERNTRATELVTQAVLDELEKIINNLL